MSEKSKKIEVKSIKSVHKLGRVLLASGGVILSLPALAGTAEAAITHNHPVAVTTTDKGKNVNGLTGESGASPVSKHHPKSVDGLIGWSSTVPKHNHPKLPVNSGSPGTLPITGGTVTSTEHKHKPTDPFIGGNSTSLHGGSVALTTHRNKHSHDPFIGGTSTPLQAESITPPAHNHNNGSGLIGGTVEERPARNPLSGTAHGA